MDNVWTKDNHQVLKDDIRHFLEFTFIQYILSCPIRKVPYISCSVQSNKIKYTVDLNYSGSFSFLCKFGQFSVLRDRVCQTWAFTNRKYVPLSLMTDMLLFLHRHCHPSW